MLILFFPVKQLQCTTAHWSGMKITLNWSMWTNSIQKKKQYLNLSRPSQKYSCHWAPQREGGTVSGVQIQLPSISFLWSCQLGRILHIIIRRERPVEPSLLSYKALKLCPFIHTVYKLYSWLLRESLLGQCFCEHAKYTFLQLIWRLFTNPEAPNEKLCSEQNLSWKRSAWDFNLNI